MLLTLMWLGVAVGMGTVIMAAMRTQEEGVCKGYEVKIEGFQKNMLFTSEEQIINLLKTAAKGDVKGQRKSDLNLPLIEDLLEQSSWVYNADLYFDNNNILHAHVTERKPLARVFAINGTSFYIDEAAKQIPLSDKVTLDLPVFTGYPSKQILNAADSALIQNVIATASFIYSDPFWNAQVGQIDIRSCGMDCWSMEMIPVVGNHKVELGDGSDIASKFHRLYLFYSQVLKRTGFDKYRKIDVQYEGQVIGIKDHYTKVDSLQLRKNIEELLQESRESNELLQVAPTIGYAATIPTDTLSQLNLIEDDGEVTTYDVVPSKEMATPPSKESGTNKIIKDIKVVKPISENKPEVVKTKSSEKNRTKTETKKIQTKKTDIKKTTSSEVSKKVTHQVPQSKKPEAKKEDVKRNLLIKTVPVKKAETKGTSSQKNSASKN